MKKHVGECAYCGHWGLLRGRWCRDKTKECKRRWYEWVTQRNRVAEQFFDLGWKNLGPQKPGLFQLLAFGDWPGWNFGRQRKRTKESA